MRLDVQSSAFDKILNPLMQLPVNLFLRGPAGTLCLQLHLSLCLRENLDIVDMCSIEGSHTARSMCKITVDGLDEETFCGIGKNSSRDDLLRQIRLIVLE
jgi:hypothetical protein